MAVEQQCEIVGRIIAIRLSLSLNIQAFNCILEMYFAKSSFVHVSL